MKVLFHLTACDPSCQPSLPSVLVHAESPAFSKPERKASCEFATSPNYTARSYLNNKRAVFLRLTFWSFTGFSVAGWESYILAVPYIIWLPPTSLLPWGRLWCCSAYLHCCTCSYVVPSQRNSYGAWTYSKAHRALQSQSLSCLSLSPSQSLSRQTY